MTQIATSPERGRTPFSPPQGPFALHHRLRPESGILPRGWLKELRDRYFEGPYGFVATDRDLPEDGGAPKVLGWGLDRRAARAAAARRSNRDPDTLLVIPCTARLQEAVGQDGAGDVRADIHDDVAYAEREAAPPLGIPLCGTPAGQCDTMIETWLEEHGVFKAHGEACGDIGDWDETICLVMAMAHAYLNAHPAVGMTEDGRLGWTKEAKLRRSFAAPAGRRSGYGMRRGGEVDDDDEPLAVPRSRTAVGQWVVALSSELDQARAEVQEKL
ncbi:MAG: hypothetical protein FJX54_22780 [Alphaproteobacteria bacterium]|nr:hypothetical protein [Alphaproteobacteria bacterium]